MPLRDDTADIKDLLQALIHTVARSDKPIRPTPRPEYAYARYQKAERKANTNWLNTQLGIASED